MEDDNKEESVISIHRNTNDNTITNSTSVSKLERRYELENKYKWKICGVKTPPNMIKYIVSVIFGVNVLIFSMIQIIRSNENKEIYFNLISFILGIFIQTPSIKK